MKIQNLKLRKWCVCLASFLFFASVDAQVVIANSESLVTTAGGTNTFTITSFNPAAGTKLVVTVSAEGSGESRTVTGVRFGDTELVEAVSRTHIDGSQTAAIWYLDNPVNAPADIVVTWSGNTNGCGIGAYSLLGTDTGAPAVSSSADGLSTDLTTLQDNTFVIGAFVANGGTNPFIEDPFTTLFTGNVGSAVGAAASTNIASAGTTTVSFDGGGSRPVVVAIGIQGEPANSDPNILVSRLSLFGDFSDEESGFFPDAEILTLRNNGISNDLIVSELVISGDDATSFSFSGQTFPLTIAPGEEAEVTFRLEPERDSGIGGTFNSQLEIRSNDADTPTVEVDLTSFILTDPEIEVASTNLLFGQLIFDEAPVTVERKLTVRNMGFSEDLNLTTNITGPDASNFTVTNVPPITVFAGDFGEITVELAPGAGTSFEATLEIMSNDPDLPLVTIPLDATLLINTSQIILVGNLDDTVSKAFLEQQTKADLVTVGTFANLNLLDNEAELSQLNNASLIIFDRASSSANYRDLDEVEFWNSVTTPIIQTNAFIAPTGRWGMVAGNALNDEQGNFITGAEANVTADGAMFLGLPEGAHDLLSDNAPGNSGAHVATVDLGDGVLLASGPAVPENSTPTTQIAYWPAGSTNGDGATYAGNRYLFGINDARVTPFLGITGNLTPSGVNALLALISREVPLKTRPQIGNVVRNTDNTMTLTWSSVPSANYTVRYSTVLDVPTSSWTIDTADIASEGASTSVTTARAFDEESMFFVVEEQ